MNIQELIDIILASKGDYFKIFDKWCYSYNLENLSCSNETRTFKSENVVLQLTDQEPLWKIHQSLYKNKHYCQSTIYNLDGIYLIVSPVHQIFLDTSEIRENKNTITKAFVLGMISCFEEFFINQENYTLSAQEMLINSYTVIANSLGDTDLANVFDDMIFFLKMGYSCDFKIENFLIDKDTGEILFWDVLYI